MSDLAKYHFNDSHFNAEGHCMYWRFWKRFKILPFTMLNVSKNGLSVSIGHRGFHLTFNRHGVRMTVGLPGTGLSAIGYRRYAQLRGSAAVPDSALAEKLSGGRRQSSLNRLCSQEPTACQPPPETNSSERNQARDKT